MTSAKPARRSSSSTSTSTSSSSSTTSAIYYNGLFQVPNPEGKLRVAPQGVPRGSDAAIQAVGKVSEPDRVDVVDAGCVPVVPELGGIARDEQ